MVKCHLCSNDQVYLSKCFKCQTYFCLNCISGLMRNKEGMGKLYSGKEMENWECFVCKKECPCTSCNIMIQSNQDKLCFICKSITAVHRVDQFIDKITISDQLKKEIVEKPWIAFLFQGNGKNEKHLCDNCYNAVIPLFLFTLQNKTEQKQGMSIQPNNVNDKKQEQDQGSIYSGLNMPGQPFQLYNNKKTIFQVAPKMDQGYPILNNQPAMNQSSPGLNTQSFLNDLIQHGNLLNDFKKNQNQPNQQQSQQPIQLLPSVVNGVNQIEMNQKMILIMVYEAITAFFNQILQNNTNILKNIKLLLDHIHRETSENNVALNEKKVSMELYFYQTAEEVMQIIFSIQLFQDQLRKLLTVFLVSQESNNNTLQQQQGNNKNDVDYANFLKLILQPNVENLFNQNLNHAPGLNPILANPGNPIDIMQSAKDVMKMMSQLQNLQQPSNNKAQSVNNMNNQSNLNVNLQSQNYNQPQINNLIVNQQGFGPNQTDLANFHNFLMQNNPKQLNISNVNNINANLSNQAPIINQNNTIQNKQQELPQKQPNLYQMQPELLNQSAFMQMELRKLIEQKQNEMGINAPIFKP